MTPHDLKTLSDCIVILHQARDSLIKKAKHCKDKNIKDCLNEVAAEINNHAYQLRKHYKIIKEEQSNEPA